MSLPPALLNVVGGLLIGAGASVLVLFNGRVAGISGIASDVLHRERGESSWRAPACRSCVRSMHLRSPAPPSLVWAGDSAESVPGRDCCWSRGERRPHRRSSLRCESGWYREDSSWTGGGARSPGFWRSIGRTGLAPRSAFRINYLRKQRFPRASRAGIGPGLYTPNGFGSDRARLARAMVYNSRPDLSIP